MVIEPSEPPIQVTPTELTVAFNTAGSITVKVLSWLQLAASNTVTV